jgi:DNA-binding MarR family transcriptional regulator
MLANLGGQRQEIMSIARHTFHNDVYRDTIYYMDKSLTSSDYEALAQLRYQIRRFLHFSEQVARESGLEPRQHQLMLTLKGLPAGTRPRIGELAERLQIQHHSTVELVNRLAAGGYVRRHRGGEDRREVLLTLTPKGERILRELSLHHRDELRMQGPALVAALKRVMKAGRGSNGLRPKLRQPGEKSANVRK